MEIEAIVNFISQVGFPIFVAVWMMYKTSKDSENMRESINELKIAITTLTENIKGGEDNE